MIRKNKYSGGKMSYNSNKMYGRNEMYRERQRQEAIKEKEEKYQSLVNKFLGRNKQDEIREANKTRKRE